MQKTLINNRLLTKKWKNQETMDLNSKVRYIKPGIKNQCPESFDFRKSHLPEHTINVRQDEIKRRNKILLEKICDVYAKPTSARNKEVFSIKLSLQEKTRRQDIQRISKENLTFSKRLIEKKPYLNSKKWYTDYNMSKYYMGNICEYPSMDFGKKTMYGNEVNNLMTNTSSNFSNLSNNKRSSSNGFKDMSSQLNMGFSRYNKSKKDSSPMFERLVDEYLNHIEDDYGVKSILYNKKSLLDEIDDCYCNFYIENKK